MIRYVNLGFPGLDNPASDAYNIVTTLQRRQPQAVRRRYYSTGVVLVSTGVLQLVKLFEEHDLVKHVSKYKR